MILTLWALLLTVVVLLDSMRNGRLHPAFGFGAAITIRFLYFAYSAVLHRSGNVWPRTQSARYLEY